eukprot:6173934-Pleurochrysis_carterae.AAC.2
MAKRASPPPHRAVFVVVEEQRKLERRKTQGGGRGSQRTVSVRKGRGEGHERGREARTGSGGELVLKGQSTTAPGTPSPLLVVDWSETMTKYGCDSA